MKSTRNELLSINPFFTAHLLNLQDLKYNPRTRAYKNGEFVNLKCNKGRHQPYYRTG